MEQKWKQPILLCLAFVCLTGCWNAKELEHMFYAHAGGVDYKDGKYIVYAQIRDFSTIGKQESGGSKNETTEGAWVGVGVGESYISALHDLYESTQRKIYWGHLNMLVFSEELLKHGADDVVDQMTRVGELRYTLWTFGTRDSVKDILLASPMLEPLPVYSQIGDPEDMYHQSSIVQPKRLYQLIAEMREPGSPQLIPLVRLSTGKWFDKNKDYTAVEIEGAAILKDGKWDGWVSRNELIGRRWLQKEVIRTPITFFHKKKPVVVLFEHPKAEVTAEVRNNDVFFTVKVNARVAVQKMGNPINESEIKRRTEQVIEEEIRRTYKIGLQKQADLMNLLANLYRKNVPGWKAVTESGDFPLNENSLKKVDVNVRITNYGRTMDPLMVEDDPAGAG